MDGTHRPYSPPPWTRQATTPAHGRPTPAAGVRPTYEPATPDFAVQAAMKEHARRAWALCGGAANFSEQGLGKTKAALDLAGEEWCAGRVTGLLVVSLNGVHRQWAEEQVPTHLGPAVPRRVEAWAGKAPPEGWLARDGALQIFCASYDALTTNAGGPAVEAFRGAHAGRLMLVLDESHAVKNPGAMRSRAAMKLRRSAQRRLILTGTPIGRRLEDEWAQLRIVQDLPLGHGTLAGFRGEYCAFGGYEGRQVVGHRNEGRFRRLTAPYVFRGTKDEWLDLPPKTYRRWLFDLDPATRRAYDALKRDFLAQIDGQYFTVANAAALVTRLQQLARGELVGEEGARRPMPDAALPALLQRLETLPEERPVLVWSRFRSDAARLERELHALGGATLIDGSVPAGDRAARARHWLEGKCRFLVANPAAAGTGLNLQGKCLDVVYYSNSWDSVLRWQSEDRVHRIGTTGTVTYYDLVARGTVDEAVLENLAKKQDLAALALGDIRRVIQGERM